MINIDDKQRCCGCEACINACPKECVSPGRDEEGFLYPKVDVSKCINCHICEKVCPEISPFSIREPQKAYAAWIKDEEIRRISSSGGIFSALAEYIIKANGIVYGASLNKNLELYHIPCETSEEIAQIRGSKYLQSRISGIYRDVLRRLNAGKFVLFSGTGCQIAGLKHFIRIDYTNLITVEIICHGVPSPMIWNDYILHILGKSYINKYREPISVSFRNKNNGWKNFGVCIEWNKKNKPKKYFSGFHQDIYMKCFLKNLTLRPSCYDCPVKNGKSGSDIVLGDFWGVDKKHPQLDDDKGLSAVIVYTEKGQRILDLLTCINKEKIEYDEILDGNPVLCSSVLCPRQRDKFWKEYLNASSNRRRHFIMSSFAYGYKRTIWDEYRESFLDVKEKIRDILRQLLH